MGAALQKCLRVTVGDLDSRPDVMGEEDHWQADFALQFAQQDRT